jgi:hypothetical protein
MTSRKQPGVTFWTTVVVVVVLVYLLSLGPATWLNERRHLSNGAMTTLYAPVLSVYECGPRPIRRATDWYLALWSKKSDQGIFFDPIRERSDD